MTTISREYINDAFWHNTIVVNTGDCSAVDFTMTLEQKKALFQTGYQTAIEIVPLKTDAPPLHQQFLSANIELK